MHPVIIGSDDHAPFNHEGRLEFYASLKRMNPKASFVHAGDLFDFHAMSRHQTEVDADNPEVEYRRALEFVKGLVKVFPSGVLVLGNHDQIPQRQMTSIGLTPMLLKESRELYGLPKTWRVEPLYYVIKPWNVLVEHGVGSSGKLGCATTALAKRCSYVQGHTHAQACVKYMTNYADTIFGMNVGCGCNEGALAMRYAKHNVHKGVLGAGVVFGPDSAHFVTMKG